MFYRNGKSWYICNYKEGQKDGEYKCWYDNGNLQIICNYKNLLKTLTPRRTLPPGIGSQRPSVASIFDAFLVVALSLCFAQANAQTSPT